MTGKKEHQLYKGTFKIIGFLFFFIMFFLALYIIFFHRITSPNLNVILITIDALKASHLSIYGYDKKTSPTIDRLAQEGILFLNAAAPAPATIPSIASIMTSNYPSFHGALSHGFYFPQENVTLAEKLKENKYLTAAFVGNFLLRKNSGLNKGFQIYDDTFPQEEKVRRNPERIASSLTEAAIEWINKHHKKKFFLWLHYQDPHGPYTPLYPYNERFDKELYKANRQVKLLKVGDNSGRGGIPWYQSLNGEQDARFYISQYDGEIAFVDYYVGKLLDQIKTLNLEKKTLIILTSDHGEAMDNDHGFYFSHGNGLTEDQIWIPLILRYPGCPKKEIVDDVVSTIDIMPTILDLLGISAPPEIQGDNLLHKKRQLIFGEFHPPSEAQEFLIRLDRYKLIDKEGIKLFYNLQTDSNESMNSYDQKSVVCLEMDKLLFNYIKAAKQAERKKIPYKPTKEEEKKLRSLGYIF